MRSYGVPAGASLLLLLLCMPRSAEPGQSEKKMSAREIFYSAPKAKQKTKPAPVVAPSPRPTQPVAPPDPVPPPVSPTEVADTKPTPPAPAPPPTPAAPPTAPEVVQVVTASHESLPPLGIRCSVLKRVGPADLVEVDQDIVFRSGDRIKVRVEVNDSGYLYIVHRGSSGVWKPLFPSPEIAGGDNLVMPGYQYDIPREHVFTFDEQPGEEKLFLVFSRQMVGDLEELIYDLSTEKPAAPGGAPEGLRRPKTLLAMNMVDIGDDFVSGLRNAHARDLIIEKVDDTSPGPRKEKAMYAVAAEAESDSRVVVDLSLIHR